MISKKNWEALEHALYHVLPVGDSMDENLLELFGDEINNIIIAAKGPKVSFFDCFNGDFWDGEGETSEEYFIELFDDELLTSLFKLIQNQGGLYQADWIETLSMMEPEMQKKFIKDKKDIEMERDTLLRIIKRNEEALLKLEEIANSCLEKTIPTKKR